MKKTSQFLPHKRRVSAALCALFILLGGVQPASAQEKLKDIITANSGLILTLVILTSASTVTYITQGLTDRLLDKMFADTQHYMDNNAAALSLDISVGAGGSLDDLATMYGLPPEEHARFCARAHSERELLLELLSHEQITHEDARAFVFAVLSPEQLERYQ